MTGKRFDFGKNWTRYIQSVDNNNIEAATDTLSKWIGKSNQKKTFLDIGCGSGLSSLAAARLGFSEIHSFDYDPECVSATSTLKQMFPYPKNIKWDVYQGSVLDVAFLAQVPCANVVYSWGVLHHTGALWKAIGNACSKVEPGGLLFLAIYNDQGWLSKYWWFVKKTYVSSPNFIKLFLICFFCLFYSTSLFLLDILRFRNPLRRYSVDARGMRFYIDLVDWIGGFPFEVSRPDLLVDQLERLGFRLLKKKTIGNKHGCNEFLFQKVID